MEERNDKGHIFENFFINERLKAGTLETFPPEIMFWRTRQGIEIDVIEKKGDQLHAYECKWKKQDVSFNNFKKMYPEAKFKVVTPEDLLLGGFILE
jgi:predicted AAA+ superfamily ATPase